MEKVRCYEPRQTWFWHSSVWRKSDVINLGRLGFGTALLRKKSDVNCYEQFCVAFDHLPASLPEIWFWHSSVWRKSDVINPGRLGFGTALYGESQML